jgi:hypothetical protein
MRTRLLSLLILSLAHVRADQLPEKNTPLRRPTLDVGAPLQSELLNSVEYLIDRSTIIVVADLIKNETVWCSGKCWADESFNVKQVLLGDFSEKTLTAQLTYPRWQPAPFFKAGDRLILFLRKGRSSSWEVVDEQFGAQVYRYALEEDVKQCVAAKRTDLTNR